MPPALCHIMNRREFLQVTGAITATTLTSPLAFSAESRTPTPARLPRWRGFNLTDKCIKRREGNPPFRETDFALMSEWGFDFARLPLSYECYTEPDDWLKLREEELNDIDAAVELGRKHGIHISLNLHRAPGYCVNPPKERLDLWTDAEALDASAFHWAHFAKRYKGVSNERVTFDLLNEPANVSEEAYVRVVRRLAQAIRAEDPKRLIIADGLRWGRDPVHGLVDLGVAQSTRGYDPMELTHYKASWVDSTKWEEPTWPLKRGNREPIDKEFLRKDRIEPWKKLEQKGVGIHVGEWGAYQYTPHKVALAWMRDTLELWKEAGWGWAMWNFRGSFGILDSRRTDIEYEDVRGHKLDRAMLKLLQQW
jgi:endoglucanase